MIYKGYEITASARTYVTWALDDDGEPLEPLDRDDGEVEGFWARNMATDEELDFIEGKWVDSAKFAVDEAIAEAKLLEATT
jgi:hypothetical protein